MEELIEHGLIFSLETAFFMTDLALEDSDPYVWQEWINPYSPLSYITLAILFALFCMVASKLDSKLIELTKFFDSSFERCFKFSPLKVVFVSLLAYLGAKSVLEQLFIHFCH